MSTGAPGVDDDGRAGIRVGDEPHQFVLAARQRQRPAAKALALHLGGRPDADEHHLGLARQRHCAFDLLVVGAGAGG